MASNRPNTFIDLLNKGLEKEVKDILLFEFNKDITAAAESVLRKYREDLHNIIAKIVFEKIESIRDIMELHDKINIYIKWKEENE